MRGFDFILSRRLSSALHKNRFTPGDRAGIHTSCRSESSNSKLGQFRQHYNLLQDYLHCKSMSPPLTFVLWFCRTCEFEQENNSDAQICNERDRKVAWPSGLRRWFKAPVSSEAWVRIPPLPKTPFFVIVISFYSAELVLREPEIFIHWPNGLGVWFLLWVQEVRGSNPRLARNFYLFSPKHNMYFLLESKNEGDTRSWTKDLPDCSRMLYHWAISPDVKILPALTSPCRLRWG